MENKSSIKKFNIWKKIICLIICLFCAFSFVACDEFEFDENGNIIVGGGGSGSGSGNSGEGDKNTLTTNESYLGVIAVYDIDSNAEVFFDKWSNSNKTFSWLVDRQFDTLATYLYDNLTRIYGEENPTNSIANYGQTAVVYSTQNIISDGDDNTNSDIIQSDIAGLTNNNTTNKNNLNYKNTISGGYALTGSGSSWSYSQTIISNNAWLGKDVYSKETLKKTLAYVYKNTQVVNNVNDEFSLNSLANTPLKEYYNNFNLTNENITNFSFESVDMIGFSKEYMWNVLYMLSYSLIGENHILDTLNNTSSIFAGANGTITSITDGNKSAFEKYKGYDIVLTNLVQNAFNLTIESGQLVYKDYFAKENWDTTLYPTMKRQEYVFFSDLDLVMYEEENNKDAKKIRSLIYIPNITDQEFIDSDLTVGYMFISLNTDDEREIEVELLFDGVFKDSEIRNSKVIFDNEYDYVDNGNIVPIVGLEDESLIDGYINYLDEVDYSLSSAVSGIEGVDIVTLINNSFIMSDYTVDNETFKKGTLKLYNQFIDVDENGLVDYKLDKNYYYFTFNYYDKEGNLLSDTPAIYVTSLYLL